METRCWVLFFLICSLFISQHSQAKETYTLLFQRTDSCHHVTLLIYSHSAHPGSNRSGVLNEKNRGIGFRCQLAEKSPYYYTINGLHNSQFGDTFAAGFGARWPIVRYSRFTLSLGGEASWIYYEHPRARKALWGFLPIATVGLTYQLPRRWGTIGYVQNHLADTNVQLYALQYTRHF